jgi:D-lactate dehydrogenase
VIEGLKSEQIGYLGLDVFEQEADLFYENLSERIIQDDVLQRLVTFPNVIVTSPPSLFYRHRPAKYLQHHNRESHGL